MASPTPPTIVGREAATGQPPLRDTGNEDSARRRCHCVAAPPDSTCRAREPRQRPGGCRKRGQREEAQPHRVAARPRPMSGARRRPGVRRPCVRREAARRSADGSAQRGTTWCEAARRSADGAAWDDMARGCATRHGAHSVLGRHGARQREAARGGAAWDDMARERQREAARGDTACGTTWRDATRGGATRRGAARRVGRYGARRHVVRRSSAG